MQGLAALLFPAVLMLFALAMEKIENRLAGRADAAGQVDDVVGPAEITTDILPVTGPGPTSSTEMLRIRLAGATSDDNPRGTRSFGPLRDRGLGEPFSARATDRFPGAVVDPAGFDRREHEPKRAS